MQKYRNVNRVLIYVVLALIVGLSSCKRDGYYTGADAKLQFSESRIMFDTVFTSVSTITKVLKVKNPYKSDIKTDIVLVGGSVSYFSINVDGVPGRHLKDVEIPAQDSIFIFIKANINPNGENNPMLACDTIAFFTNGNRQNVELLAYGQDAHFIIPNTTKYILYGQDTVGIIPNCRIIAGKNENIVWKNDKPYVIYGYALVDSDAKLTIEKGARIHFHKNGGLFVYIDGCLEVNGTKDEPVTFQGDRLDKRENNDYKQWDRIWICESNNDSKIEYAVIKNAFIGIQTETLIAKKSGKLTLSNTVIQSCHRAGLLSMGYAIDAYNNIFSNCVEHCVGLQGGSYTFTNNTIYNQYSFQRKIPALYISNFFEITKDVRILDDFSGVFVNNIISGRISGDTATELYYNIDKRAAFSALFENCLIRTTSSKLSDASISAVNTLLNRDPAFVNIEKFDFKLESNSPCKSAGKSIIWLTTDIEGNPRNVPPSVGAYE